MPSPIAHCSLVFGLLPPIERRIQPSLSNSQRRALIAALIGALLAPDLDILFGPLTGAPLMTYHNGPTHSLILAPLFGLLCAGLAWGGLRRGMAVCGVVGTLAYAGHVLLDAVCWGRGVLMFWPLSESRFGGPPYLFMGVRHSKGLFVVDHLLTLLNELAFVTAIWLAAWGLQRWQRRRESMDRQIEQAADITP